MIEKVDWDSLNISTEVLTEQLFQEKHISVSVLRLDKLDPFVSGNKIFKLKYYLLEALALNATLITFGGAYSNHLYATAAACKRYNIRCLGIVRGERNANLSHTLQFCEGQGMKLKFISRSAYDRKEHPEYLNELLFEFGPHILVPEGGSGKEGVAGAGDISAFCNDAYYSHTCCAVGSGTTIAGLIQASLPNRNIIGFSVVGKQYDLHTRIASMLPGVNSKHYTILNDYHFGGFAKRSPGLLAFMNTFYANHNIPTDFVYTGKMLYGIFDLVLKDYFQRGSKILCIHTGGLQGNASLPNGSLVF